MKRTALITGILVLGIITAFSQEELDDRDIADAIENQYRFDHAINLNRIDVEVMDGIAELTGTVTNLKAKERATRIAELVKGVRSVSNRIQVDPPGEISEEGLRENVLMALLSDPATESYEVDVSVDDGKVTLTGSVDSYQEKQLAGHVAGSVKGVVELTNNIDVDYETGRADQEIESEIEEAFRWDAQLEAGLIDVLVENGEVELSGTVGSAAEKTNAYFTSWVAGVTSVDNSDLKVQHWAEDEELRKNKYVPAPDAEIEDAIKDVMLYDPRVYSFEITTEIENGWVTLRGMVDNLKAKKAAEKLAGNTTGVIGVNNRIRVRAEVPVTDAEIKEDINTSLARNAITESWQVDVLVNNGTVTLSGVVDSYLEKKEAEWVASGVEGVDDVNNNIRVNYPVGYYWWGNYPHYDLFVEPPATSSLTPDDRKIRRNVENELWWSPFVDRDQITIYVENGNVTLEGTVDSWREYRKAVENAWEGGAWSVTNELAVKGS